MNSKETIQMSETRDEVAARIDGMLLGLPCTHTQPSISRVNDAIRRMNGKFYEPKLLSIGPFHHGKDQVCKMEQHKFSYLKLLLKRRNESSVDRYVMAMRSLEEKARKCYGEPINFNQDEFVEMLLLDGVFIIELLRKHGLDELRDKEDTIFQHKLILSQLRHDLLLLENQIPFFVLHELFTMTIRGNPDDDITFLIQLFVDPLWPANTNAYYGPEVISKKPFDNVDHLLGLVHKTWFSSFALQKWCQLDLLKPEKIISLL